MYICIYTHISQTYTPAKTEDYKPGAKYNKLKRTKAVSIQGQGSFFGEALSKRRLKTDHLKRPSPLGPNFKPETPQTLILKP